MTCAYAVRVALMKFPGVESADVSLNKGLATVKLKPGNTIRPSEFWEAIRKNGNTPKATRVTVRGEVEAGETFPRLRHHPLIRHRGLNQEILERNTCVRIETGELRCGAPPLAACSTHGRPRIAPDSAAM